ncbi:MULTISPECIES: STAS domain-containing protein [unclassified Streptomyces]|uniref:STAS domain-containing protein n=1 Tax=unclassified Streptomyces TaxID=2593676 RepID=UPI0007C71B9B|nr:MULTISPECIES: STAS domain-containing protein [unclassified Streptomyces]
MNTAPDDSVFHLDTAHDASGDAHIRITGDLDWDSADDLAEAARTLLCADPAPRRLHLDCARLTLCDSLGLASLLMVHRTCAEAGVSLHLDNRPALLRRLLDLTGTAFLFDDDATGAEVPDTSGEAAAPPSPPPPSRA